jgi:hypothetical protein
MFSEVFSTEEEYMKAEREWVPIAFDQSKVRVIGRRDDYGNLVPVDPQTLSPDILRMFYGYDSEGNPMQSARVGLEDQSPSSLYQTPPKQG